MKLAMCLGLIMLSLIGAVNAAEIQHVSGDEAYEIYLKLPGKACQEYRIANYVVYTKYQTPVCSETQNDNSKWSCTVQFGLKNGKKSGVMSADCTREI